MRAALASQTELDRSAPTPIFRPDSLITSEIPYLGKGDEKIYRQAFKLAHRGQWRKARAKAEQAEHKLPGKVLTWLYLAEPGTKPTFDELAGFVMANPNWPRRVHLLRRAEKIMPSNLGTDEILDWFSIYPPVSGEGKLRQAFALIQSKQIVEGSEQLRDAWVNDKFSRTTERKVIKEYHHLLADHDDKERLDRLLWDGQRSASRRMSRRVEPGWQALAKARLALMERAGNVDRMIAKVPGEMVSSSGLAYERVRWRRRKGLHDRAQEMLLDAPDQWRVSNITSDIAGSTGAHRPDKWWKERRFQARKALEAGEFEQAYQLVQAHGATRSVNKAEAEWLAGWIALRFLNRPGQAYEHFLVLYDTVSFPVSVARASYWAGRSAEAQQRFDLALRWYGEAANHPTTFYGQIALAEANMFRNGGNPPTDNGHAADLILDDASIIPGDQYSDFENNELVKAAKVLAILGERKQLKPFLLQLAALAQTPDEKALVAALPQQLGRPDLGVLIAKKAIRENLMLISNAYPVLPPFTNQDISNPGNKARATPESALLLALARQESIFDEAAVSRVGARGLMQLMPATAKLVAGKLGMPYSASRLTADPAYNAKLGAAYLGRLLNKYRGSYILALAAYNAGESRVASWIRKFGDPRLPAVNNVDWIEMIPFSETRNYVQRVLESVQVYRHRLADRRINLTLISDLNRASFDPKPVVIPKRRPPGM